MARQIGALRAHFWIGCRGCYILPGGKDRHSVRVLVICACLWNASSVSLLACSGGNKRSGAVALGRGARLLPPGSIAFETLVEPASGARSRSGEIRIVNAAGAIEETLRCSLGTHAPSPAVSSAPSPNQSLKRRDREARSPAREGACAPRKCHAAGSTTPACK
jgi:hypothetical protein